MRADQQITDRVAFVERQRDVRRIRSEYNPVVFGNAVVEYSSPDLRLRVTKDRGQFLCDFAATNGPLEWFTLGIVFRDLGESASLDALIAEKWSSLDSVAATVEDHFSRILDLFSEQS